jgi:hypothetical protein
MIRVIDKANVRLFARTMDQLFRVRHSVFVEEKGWREFERDGLFEKDQFDTEDATYVVALDEHCDAIGCFRLYPTVLPHMISEVFPNLVEGEVLRRSDVLELTRFHLSKPKRRAREYLELLTAIPEIVDHADRAAGGHRRRIPCVGSVRGQREQPGAHQQDAGLDAVGVRAQPSAAGTRVMKQALLREPVVRAGQPLRQGDDVPAIFTGGDFEKRTHQKQTFRGQNILPRMNGYGGRR